MFRWCQGIKPTNKLEKRTTVVGLLIFNFYFKATTLKKKKKAPHSRSQQTPIKLKETICSCKYIHSSWEAFSVCLFVLWKYWMLTSKLWHVHKTRTAMPLPVCHTEVWTDLCTYFEKKKKLLQLARAWHSKKGVCQLLFNKPNKQEV